MAEDRAKHTNVIASTIAQTNDSLCIRLIGNPQPRCEVLVAGAGIAPKIDSGFPSNPHLTSGQVNPAAAIRTRRRLRPIDLPAKARVDGQLGRQPNGILSVEEQTRLRLVCVRRVAHVALEVTDLAEQEAS